jgi:hypothetical protein
MEYEYESDENDDIPYVELELDIKDVHTIYKSVCLHLDNWSGEDEYENERLNSLKDFLYRIILEYKFAIE